MRKQWWLIGIVIVCTGVFFVRYVRINRKYPNPMKYTIIEGETFTYHNVDITVTDAEIVESTDDARSIEVTMQLTGHKGDVFDLTRTAIVDGFCRAAPDYEKMLENVGSSRISFDQNETVYATLGFSFFESNYFKEDWETWNQRSFAFVLVDTYPVGYYVSLDL